LVDWLVGGRAIHLDGKDTERNAPWDYRLNAGANSSCGRYAAIYERLETKAALLDSGKLLIDVNTGSILQNWPEVATGTRNDNILHEIEDRLPLAIDPMRRRFAVALNGCITVIEFEP